MMPKVRKTVESSGENSNSLAPDAVTALPTSSPKRLRRPMHAAEAAAGKQAEIQSKAADCLACHLDEIMNYLDGWKNEIKVNLQNRC